jgi:hypothetical protein
MGDSHSICDMATPPRIAFLGQIVIIVFKNPLPANSQIDVTYTLDLDGILKVEALDVTTGARAVGAFTSGALLSADQLAESRRTSL